MVMDAVTALNDGFSAHNVTEWVRQMANLAQQNGEDLDLPLSDDPAFKWYVSHAEVKKHVEQLYNNRVVDRTFGNGYFVYSVVTNAPVATTPVVNASSTVPTSTPTTQGLLNKLVNYVNNYTSRCGFAPTAKEVQSRLKRDSNMTCLELVDYANRNGIPVTLGNSPSVTLIG